MAVLDWSERTRDGGPDLAPSVKVAQQPADRLGSNGVRQEWPARERRQQVKVRVILGGMATRDRSHGMIGVDVAHDVLQPMQAALPVSKAVACLRKEDTKAHHQREQDGRETGRSQTPHQPNIAGWPGASASADPAAHWRPFANVE